MGVNLCSCSTRRTHRVTLVTNLMIIHEWGKGLIVITTNETYMSHRFAVTDETDEVQAMQRQGEKRQNNRQ